jgi:hypothetical protein
MSKAKTVAMGMVLIASIAFVVFLDKQGTFERSGQRRAEKPEQEAIEKPTLPETARTIQKKHGGIRVVELSQNIKLIGDSGSKRARHRITFHGYAVLTRDIVKAEYGKGWKSCNAGKTKLPKLPIPYRVIAQKGTKIIIEGEMAVRRGDNGEWYSGAWFVKLKGIQTQKKIYGQTRPWIAKNVPNAVIIGEPAFNTICDMLRASAFLKGI